MFETARNCGAKEEQRSCAAQAELRNRGVEKLADHRLS